MDIKGFIDLLESGFEAVEEDMRFTGPYTDAFEIHDDVVEIPFEDGQRFRLTIEKIL